jgi:SAM-dependent methyltransferase
VQLEDDFERISSAYKLFAHQDDQLLRQSGYVRDRATLILVKALSSLFSHPPVREAQGALPDTQTQQLAQHIRDFAKVGEQQSIKILDLGAGVGRQIAEMHKLSEWQIGAGINWTCYEPFESSRREIRARFARTPGVTVVEDISDLRGGFDFCVLANVLHELTPPEFANFIAMAADHTSHGQGGLVVLEIYPLLHPEGYAVPYDPTTLLDILEKCGFLVDVAQISLARSSTIAYCILAQKQAGVDVSRDDIQRNVEEAWEQILKRSLSAYAVHHSPTDLQAYQKVLSHLTTIASITSWKARKWLPR